jgi:hypothetical protein
MRDVTLETAQSHAGLMKVRQVRAKKLLLPMPLGRGAARGLLANWTSLTG